MDEKQSIKKGLFWMGVASLVSKIVDVSSLFVTLIFISKEELGLATLAWSMAVFLEAFNGFGISAAIIQAAKISKKQLDSLFWYIMAIASFMIGVVILFSPVVADFYNDMTLASLMIVPALKLLFVGAALIPLQLLNRELRFKEISTIRMAATFFSAVTCIVLVSSGYGAWAIVIAHSSFGLFQLIGVYIVKPFIPSFRFSFSEVKHLIIFGAKVAVSGIVYHFYRNMDYFIIGRFLGKEALGIYKVAFDVSMKASEEILNVINRTVFPIFTRLAKEPEKLAKIFIWSSRNLALLLMPVAVVLFYCSEDLLGIIENGKWTEAAASVRILCWAALLRCLAMVFPNLYHSIGKPTLAIYQSLLSCITLGITFTIALHYWGEAYGSVAVCVAWLVSYPLLILLFWWFSNLYLPIRFMSYLRGLKDAFIGGVLMFLSMLPVYLYFEDDINMWISLFLYLSVGLSTYLLFLRLKLKISIKSLFSKSESEPTP